MKIKTERIWDIEITPTGYDCLELRERHEGSDLDYEPSVFCVPVEAVDEIVLELLKFKKKWSK